MTSGGLGSGGHMVVLLNQPLWLQRRAKPAATKLGSCVAVPQPHLVQGQGCHVDRSPGPPCKQLWSCVQVFNGSQRSPKCPSSTSSSAGCSLLIKRLVLMSAVCEPWVGRMVGPFSAFDCTHPTVSWQMPGLADCVKFGRRLQRYFPFF